MIIVVVLVATVKKCKIVSVLKNYAMKANGEVEVESDVFLISALVGGEWSA
jgi:hypothetical protein